MYSTDGAVESSPEVGKDGTIYVGSSDNRVYCLYEYFTNATPTVIPTVVPSSPSVTPTYAPTVTPTTATPTVKPTKMPTLIPSVTPTNVDVATDSKHQSGLSDTSLGIMIPLLVLGLPCLGIILYYSVRNINVLWKLHVRFCFRTIGSCVLAPSTSSTAYEVLQHWR